MPMRLSFLVLIALAACGQEPSPQAALSTGGPQPGAGTLHSFSIARAYSLMDPRELAFRDQIAAEARARCGFGDYSLYSARPVGDEEVRPDFLYRDYDVQITCDS